jgi:alkylation response protein AidB-like acyl-CoA dehydrogenase
MRRMLDFSEEHKAAQKAIRAWCTQRLEPSVATLERNEVQPYPLIRELATTFGIPDLARARIAKLKEKGEGARVGGDGALMAILFMELSRCCPGFCLAFGATIGLFGGAVMAKGTPEQIETWALPVLTFEKIGCWGLTEPGAGSDAFGSMRTRCRKDGGDWIVKGQKTFITNAPYADVMVVYAKDEGSNEIRSFLVTKEDKGVAVGPPMRKMGMHASPTGEIFLDEVRLGADRLLGGEKAENQRDAAKSSLNQERFGMTPMALGIVDRCLEESIKYAKQREQWGKPIATFQLVQEKIARIYTARTMMMNLLLRQLEAERAKVNLPTEEASAAKLYCARMATECALEAVQIKGGAGYMADGVVEMLARDAKLLQIGGGTDEIQMLRIARELLSA